MRRNYLRLLFVAEFRKKITNGLETEAFYKEMEASQERLDPINPRQLEERR